MRLGVLGGTFDPIHLGHLLVAEAVRDELDLDRVLFVPAGDPPHKQEQSITSAHHRQKMVEEAITGNQHFELCTIDLNRPGPHYSVDTVRLIRKQHQLTADDCYFIVGGDSLANIPGWHQPERLVRRCRLAVVHRPGVRPDLINLDAEVPGLSAAVVWISSPMLALSATEIRERVAAGRSIRYQVPERVRNYILERRLYR